MNHNALKMWRNRAWIFLGLGALLLWDVVARGYWKQSGNAMNVIHMGNFQNKIVETYTVPAEVNPGDTIEKIVNVANTGDVDSLIRLSVKTEFGERNIEGKFVEEKGLDGDVIRIMCDTNGWLYKDGYYYYKDILKAGETTRYPLFRQYTFSENAENAYKGKQARILVTMEAIQADADLLKCWDVSFQELGITWDIENRQKDIREMSVVYKGKEGGFLISESSTDLFASFTGLTPGCGRTQRITIENRSSETVELLLRSEAVEQLLDTQKKREAVQKLLNQDAVIRITEGTRELYLGPISGKVKHPGISMTEDISLGIFQAGKKRELLVTLRVNPDADASGSGLLARVRWVFTAKGDDAQTVTSGYFPQTGDGSQIYFWTFLLLGSGYAIIRMQNKQKEKQV